MRGPPASPTAPDLVPLLVDRTDAFALFGRREFVRFDFGVRLVKRESRQDRMGPEIQGRPPEANRCSERGDPQEYRTGIEGRGGDIGTEASTCGCALTTRPVEGHVAGAVARRETYGRAFGRGQRPAPNR